MYTLNTANSKVVLDLREDLETKIAENEQRQANQIKYLYETIESLENLNRAMVSQIEQVEKTQTAISFFLIMTGILLGLGYFFRRRKVKENKELE